MSWNNAVILTIPIVTLISIAATYYYHWKTPPVSRRRFFRKCMSAVVKWGLVSANVPTNHSANHNDTVRKDCMILPSALNEHALNNANKAYHDFDNHHFRRWKSLAIKSISCSGLACISRSVESSRIYRKTSILKYLKNNTDRLKFNVKNLVETEHPVRMNEELSMTLIPSGHTTFKGDAFAFDDVTNSFWNKSIIENKRSSVFAHEQSVEAKVAFIRPEYNALHVASQQNKVSQNRTEKDCVSASKDPVTCKQKLLENSAQTGDTSSSDENQSPAYQSLTSNGKTTSTTNDSNPGILYSKSRCTSIENADAIRDYVLSFKDTSASVKCKSSIPTVSLLKDMATTSENTNFLVNAFGRNTSVKTPSPYEDKIGMIEKAGSSIHKPIADDKPTEIMKNTGLVSLSNASHNIAEFRQAKCAVETPASALEVETMFTSLHQDTEVVGQKNKHSQRLVSSELKEHCQAKKETGDDCEPLKPIPDIKVEKTRRAKHPMLELFQYVRLIAKGSFGKVALTKHVQTKQYVAVKYMKKIARLMGCIRRERMVFGIINSSDHPFLVHLCAAFQIKTHVFFAMEYIPGKDLNYHVQMTPTWDLQVQAIFYSACVILALEFLHSNHIIHRDLKLQNILMCEDGYVKLADYGLSRKLEPGEYAHSVCGTLTHMAPEILNKEMYTRATDWWALGIVLYEMMAKKCPFYGKEKREVLDLIYRNCLIFPTYLKADAIEIVRKLLKRNPKERLGYLTKNEENIKSHPFYKDIEWDKLYKKQVKAPYLPTLQAEQQCESSDTKEWPSFTESEQPGQILEIHLQDFSYVLNQ